MSKKQIVILVGIGLFVILITMGLVYFITNKDNSSSKKKDNKTEIVVGKYKVKYGKYKGISEEYDPDTETLNKDEVLIEITDNKIITLDITQSYKIEGNKIVTAGGVEYEVVGNNKLILLAGGGVELNYEGN